jgi:pyrimidine-nucleoside phosphorylase
MLRLAGLGEKCRMPLKRAVLENKLDDGQVLAKFRLLAEAQGGDVRMIDDPTRRRRRIIEGTCFAGWIRRTCVGPVAQAAFELGAGRQKRRID